VLVLVNPGFPVSTKEAYQTLDASRAASRRLVRSDADIEDELRSVVMAYAGEPPASWRFRNDFFDALVPGLPGLAECRDALLAEGASFAAMSGSGSALFGVFMTETDAERAAEALASRYEPKIAFPLARLRDSI
jgi:4-diphosphocytidyl-2-C-methyl-D-erythritol kinase